MDPSLRQSKIFERDGQLTSRQREFLRVIAEGEYERKSLLIFKMSAETVEANRLAIGIKSNFNREPASEIFTKYKALKSPSRWSVDRHKGLNA